MDRLFHLYCILVDWDYTYIFIMLVAHDMEWLFACIEFYRIWNFIISCVLCVNVVSVHACQMCFSVHSAVWLTLFGVYVFR